MNDINFAEILSNAGSEYDCLDIEFGEGNYSTWGQALLKHNGKKFDALTIKLKDGSLHTRYFPVRHK